MPSGTGALSIQTRMGETELAIPRDRNGEFEPHIIDME
nr:transposase [Acididesulfobacillus acetoxydans]